MWQHRWLRLFVLATSLALVGQVGATVASAAPPPGTPMEGTGPQVKGVGMFSKEALAQEHCADNARMWATYEGGGPWCVNPWPAGKSNGGNTAEGVTATAVKVIVYSPNSQMVTAQAGTKPMNRATKEIAPMDLVVRDMSAAYTSMIKQYDSFQTYGRTLELEVFNASGPDEAAQRADAVAVIAKKPFAVFDVTKATEGGAPTFSTVVAASKIVVVSSSTNAENSVKQAPYRWNFGADPSANEALTGAFVGRSLTGKKAQWAGDDSLKTKTRSFAAVYPVGVFDDASFESYLTKNGGKLADKASYTPGDPQAAAQLATAIQHFKSVGVTSVVLFAEPPLVTALMAAATSQDYHPEWVYTGYGYADLDNFARSNDQTQMKGAFGLGVLGPYVSGTYPASTAPTWYWGANLGNYYAILGGGFEFLYSGMHYAGPNLTPKTLQQGQFSAPVIGPATPGISTGVAGYGKTVGLPYDEYSHFGSDRSLIWWDGQTTGNAQATGAAGLGVFQFLNNGAASKYSDFTKTTPKFFEPSVSVFQITAGSQYPPANVVPATLPCVGCPVSGTPAGTTS